MPTSQQRKQLQNALISAFPEKLLLEQLIDYELDKKLNQIAQDNNLKTVVYQLIQRAEAEGWLLDLVRAARKENPRNSQIEAIATELIEDNLTITAYNSSKENAIAEYRLKVEEFAEDGEISYGESEILKDLQKKLKLTEEEVRTIRDEALEPFGRYRENLDKYRQVFTKWVDEQGYPLKEKAKADLKKVQEHYQLKDEDIALLEKEAEQQAVEKLCQEHRKAEYQAKLQRYEKELSKAVNVAYPLDEYVRNGLKSFQQFLGLLDEDVALIEQSVIAPAESEYRRQLETKKLKRQQEEAQRRQRLEQELNSRQQQPTSSDDLSSDRNVDYTQLRDFLKAGQWKKADDETLAVMLVASGREKEGWFSIESIKNFPCTDLRTIDQLWVEYTNGRFGFSVQKRIWESVGQDYEKFGVAIGWRNCEWIDYSKVTLDTKAPDGYFPCEAVSVGQGGGLFLGRLMSWGELGANRLKFFSIIVSRLIHCNI